MSKLKLHPEDNDTHYWYLHKFLYYLFTENHRNVGSDFYNCSVTRHTMLNQLQQDLLFKRPGVMASSCAADQYCMHLTFMQEIYLRSDDYVDEDDDDSCPDFVQYVPLVQYSIRV